MQITNFQISADRDFLNITINDAGNLTSLYLWSDSTYKDYSKVFDLTNRLTGATTEIIQVSLADLAYKYFSGVYFLEANDDNYISNAITSDLSRYKECIINKVSEYSVCEECLKDHSIELINAQGLLRALQDSIDLGYINEILILTKALNIFCSDTCKSCGEYKNIIDNTYYSTNNG